MFEILGDVYDLFNPVQGCDWLMHPCLAKADELFLSGTEAQMILLEAVSYFFHVRDQTLTSDIFMP